MVELSNLVNLEVSKTYLIGHEGRKKDQNDGIIQE